MGLASLRAWVFFAAILVLFVACVGSDEPSDATAPRPDETPLPHEEPPPRERIRTRTAVLTQHNDLARTGANTKETALDIESVSSKAFGRLGSYDVDGQIYAQPLYVPDLETADGARHDAVIVATEHNSVYAFDANVVGSAPLWQAKLGASFPIAVLWPACVDLVPEVGITSTPAIDLATKTIFVTTKHLEGNRGVYRLHALDLASGNERDHSPIVIEGSVPGTAKDAVDGRVVFDAKMHLQRPGVTLANGVVWLAFGAHCDYGPYHGWIFAYDATTLAPRGVHCTTASGDGAGVWQAGQGLSADESGDVYFMTGNGSFDAAASFGSSFLRLHAGTEGISVVSTFTPYNYEWLSDADYDLGSAGVLLLPGTKYVVGGGKEGRLYVLDRDAMGGLDPAGDTQIPQSFQATRRPQNSHIHGSPVYYAGPDREHVYVWGETDVLRDFALASNGTFDPTPRRTSKVAVPEGMPGAMISLSSDGTTRGTAIVWASHPEVENSGGERIVSGVLRAFDALDVSHELWNSAAAPNDAVGMHAKFAAPTVADGRVYLATFSEKLAVYGLAR